MSVDQEQLRTAMRNWVSGVTVVTAVDEDATPVGITASSFTSVSLDPPLVLICLFKETDAARAVLVTGGFTANILADDQAALSTRFAGFDPDFPKDADRFADLKTQTLVTGAPLLEDALSGFDCQVTSTHDGGTHYVFIAEVVGVLQQQDAGAPLVYYNRKYHDLTAQD
jgi:flavin reductase (DIM6/NTAB) family NADH-FMN oxidoreductase RutF